MKIFIKFFGLACLVLGCSEDIDRTVKNQAFRLSDSTFSANYSFYRQEADSLCRQLQDQKFQLIVDSILQVRRSQIHQLRQSE